MEKTVKLYYAKLANMGDLLNVLIIENCFGLKVERHSFLTGEMSAIGSGLGQYVFHGGPLMKLRQGINGLVRPHVSVWGTGFINYDERDGRFFKRDMAFHALRGRLSLRRVERMLGKSLDIPTGDGGILASELLSRVPEKKYSLGIIPHICDLKDEAVEKLKESYENAIVINVKDEPLQVVEQIAQCGFVLSSSLHGLVVADSFNIPNMHVLFSDRLLGDGFKFDDYYSAYGLEHRARDLRLMPPPSLEEIGDSYGLSPAMVADKKKLMRECFPELERE